MSVENFKQAYNDEDLRSLRKYIKSSRVLSVDEFVTYVEKSFLTNREIYDILVLILFNKYNLNKVVVQLIKLDKVDLLEDILSTNIPKHNRPDLDEKIILNTIPNGRITMAKTIYEYIYQISDPYDIIVKLLGYYNFKFVPNKNANSIDSFILALGEQKYPETLKMIPYINLNCWDNFIIKFAVAYGNVKIVKRILRNNTIDPGIDDNWALNIAINRECYDIANELLKHPLVSTMDSNNHFIRYIMEKNLLCVAKKILQPENSRIITCFKKYEYVALRCNNDVTYLAIKLGIIAGGNINRRFLEKMDTEYMVLPYELNLDPIQICKMAFKEGDIDLAKNIKNYSISIPSNTIVKFLIKYKYTDVYDYVLNNRLKQYDPTKLIVSAGYLIDMRLDKSLFKKILNVVKDNPNINYETVYGYSNSDIKRKYILKAVKLKYSEADYEIFVAKCVKKIEI